MHEWTIFSDEAPSGLYRWYSGFNRGRSSLHFVRVVQIELFLREPLMLWANSYCKIVMWLKVRWTPLDELGGSVFIHYCIKIWLSKTFVRVGSHKNYQKKFCVDWSKEMLTKYDIGVSKHVHDIVIGNESHFQSNGCQFFRICRNLTTGTTQEIQFWVVQNHLFASGLPIIQNNQPSRKDDSS